MGLDGIDVEGTILFVIQDSGLGANSTANSRQLTAREKNNKARRRRQALLFSIRCDTL